MFSHSDTRLRPWILSLSLSLATLATPVTATESPSACDAPAPLLPTDQHRRPEGLIAETHCYRLDLPSAGLLHLDLAVAGWSPSRARLSVAGTGGGAFEILERSAVEWLATASAGSYLLEIAAEDPRRPLPAYRLSSRFVEWTKSDTDGELELDPETLKSDTDGELELDPETFKSDTDGELELDPETNKSAYLDSLACLDAGFGSWGKSDTDGELELDPETLKSDTDGELELDPETSKIGRLWRRSAALEALCRNGDDHGDSRACATPIERRAAGQLGNGWGDDDDVFRFRLCGWQTIEIATAGDADTHGRLYDRAGQLLAGDDDGGDGGNFRLVRTLGPGTYFVRVEGVQSTGGYTLAMAGTGR